MLFEASTFGVTKASCHFSLSLCEYYVLFSPLSGGGGAGRAESGEQEGALGKRQAAALQDGSYHAF